MNTTLNIILGDCCEITRGVPAESVHLVVTSPPYDKMRTCYDTEFDFERLAMELTRVLVPGGIICWNVNDSVVDGSETLTSCRQKIFFHDQCGLRVHDTMIWKKPNFSNPEKVRYHQLFEYVFVLSKGKPRCFNPIKDKLNKYPGGPWGRNTYRLPSGEMAERGMNPAQEYGMRGNVWSGNTVGQERPLEAKLHPAMMPNWLARDLIVSWSNKGDVVLDPLCGAGTTLTQAVKLGRSAIGIDNDPKSIETCNRELAEVLHKLEKAL